MKAKKVTKTKMKTMKKMIVMKSSDGETFDVAEAVAVESQTIKHMIENDCTDTTIPLPNVTSKILAKVTEYRKKHVEAPKSDDFSKAVDDDLKAFDTEFVKVDQATLFDLILSRSSSYGKSKDSRVRTSSGTFKASGRVHE